MPRTRTVNLDDEVKKLIDASSVRAVLYAVARVAERKADQVGEDDPSAMFEARRVQILVGAVADTVLDD
jgi:hypothetical protein